MKAVLISIQPKWVEKIANGEKTIEVRKTTPKQVPFKCYIYCTKASKKYQTICGCMVINTDELYRLPNGEIKHDWSGELMCCNGEYTRDNFLNGKVIGEFICDNVEWMSMRDCDKACMTLKEAVDYAKGKKLYAWHISDLKIYDKPKELREFRVSCPTSCENCKNPLYYECWCEEKGVKVLTRAPQSWQYVEE